MATHDFRRGGWGHCLHSSTWRELPPRLERRWFRRALKHPRYSILAHVWKIETGDLVLYVASGGDRVADVIDVERMMGTNDMFRLTLENVRPYSAPALSTEGASHD